jgi:glutamate dehydrogenase
LWDGIGALPRSDRWQTQARSALRDDLLAMMIALTSNVMEDASLEAWLNSNERSVARTIQQLTQIRRADAFDITNLSVALRQLRNLAQTSVRGT